MEGLWVSVSKLWASLDLWVYVGIRCIMLCMHYVGMVCCVDSGRQWLGGWMFGCISLGVIVFFSLLPSLFFLVFFLGGRGGISFVLLSSSLS